MLPYEHRSECADATYEIDFKLACSQGKTFFQKTSLAVSCFGDLPLECVIAVHSISDDSIRWQRPLSHPTLRTAGHDKAYYADMIAAKKNSTQGSS